MVNDRGGCFLRSSPLFLLECSMFDYAKYRDVRREYFGESNKEIRKNYKKYKAARGMKSDCLKAEDFMKAKKALEKANVPGDIWVTFDTPSVFQFAPLPKAVPAVSLIDDWYTEEPVKKEGKTPMRYNETNAYASVSAPKSDIAIQRDFLLSQLADAWYPKERELEKFFNLYVDNTPKTYKEMIEAIKNGKYTIDPKAAKQIEADEDDEDDFRCWGPLFGIVWDGPQPDREGYTKARAEACKQKIAAERTIMTADGTAGLAALQAFEAWLPTSEAGAAS
jgi:hypothetical protein